MQQKRGTPENPIDTKYLGDPYKEDGNWHVDEDMNGPSGFITHSFRTEAHAKMFCRTGIIQGKA